MVENQARAMKGKISHAAMVRAIEALYEWQSGTGPGTFTARLYSLLSAADPRHRAVLCRAFPAEGSAFRLWNKSPHQDTFFAEWLPDYPPTEKPRDDP